MVFNCFSQNHIWGDRRAGLSAPPASWQDFCEANRKSVCVCVCVCACVLCSSWTMIIKYIFLKLRENQRDLFEAGQIAVILQMTVMADFWEDAGA